YLKQYFITICAIYNRYCDCYWGCRQTAQLSKKNMLKINIDNISDFVSSSELDFWKPKVVEANKMLYGKSGKGSDYLGWIDLPSRITEDELKDIEDRAVGLMEISDIIVVIGI